MLFRNAFGYTDVPDELTMRIQPDEGIALKFEAKLPGPVMWLRAGDDGVPLWHLLRCGSRRCL
ncbi:MAG: hypothetical protein KatS3mg057_2833 [Herpetosiphonaceae bacterium]|nr:MAG: hypothetical protein KatS3mg057_2833 [Herpetosiphonaceae bacterium]